MSQKFREDMRTIARTAELNGLRQAAEYQRLAEILEANPGREEAETALWAEYDATGKDFFKNKAWDVHLGR